MHVTHLSTMQCKARSEQADHKRRNAGRHISPAARQINAYWLVSSTQRKRTPVKYVHRIIIKLDKQQ
jgi:hypothetical protein